MVQLAKSVVITLLIILFLSVSETAFAAAAATCDVPTTTHATIQSAVDDAACGTINIAAGAFNENVTVARDVIIRGTVNADNQALTTVDGQQLASVFTINGFNTVVLRNLIIQNGQAATNGGGVYIVDNASVTLDNARVNNNSAENGGGLYAQDGYLHIIDTDFHSNHANQLGGGLFAALGSADIRNFSMSYNSATDGGALGVANAFLILENGNLSNNYATNNGGAIFLTVPNGSSSFTSLNLSHNAAGNFGGAIFSRRGLSLTGSGLNDNHATNGGGIYIERNNLNLMQTSLTNNQASGNGGGIYHTKTVPGFVVDAKLTVTKSSFTDNATKGSGGAIYAEGDIDATLNEVGFYRNSADNDGGGLFVSGGETAIVRLNANILQHNTAGSVGGAVSAENSIELTISNSYVSHNQSGVSGGAIAARFVDSVNLFASNLAHNAANGPGLGGGLMFEIGTLSIDSMLFEHNTVEGAGGAISANGNTRIRNSTIYKNSAGFGGGIAQFGGPLDIEATAFDHNSAVGDGGGLALTGTLVGEMRNSSVTNNRSGGRGGGLFIVSNFSIKRALVGYNSAARSGGGIQVFQATGGGAFDDVRLDQVSVYRNRAENGGGIAHQGAPLKITNSTLSENAATNSGSALYGADAVIATYSTIAFNETAGAVHKVTAATPFIFEFSILYNPAVDNCTGDISTIQLASTIDSDGTCSLTRTPLTGIDPLLAPLADNGNDLMSHALLPNSPAMGVGADCPTLDQHDSSRPAAYCDLGAYQSPRVPTAVALSAQTAQATTTSTALLGLIFLLVASTLRFVVIRKASTKAQ